MNYPWSRVKVHPTVSDNGEDDDYDVAHYKIMNAKLEQENSELKDSCRQKDFFIQSLLMKIVDQAKPLQRTPSAAELYMQTNDGAAALPMASAKDINKSRLPG